MLNNDEAAAISPPPVKGGILEEWVQMYNHTASAIANGAILSLTFKVDYTVVAAPILYHIGLTPATNVTPSLFIGVVDNDPVLVSGAFYAGIPAYTSGWVKLKGTVQALVDDTSADVAPGDQLEVLTTGVSFIVAAAASSGVGVALVESAAAIALEAKTGNTSALKWVYLLGRRVAVQAT